MLYQKRPPEFDSTGPESKRGRFMSLHDCVDSSGRLPKPDLIGPANNSRPEGASHSLPSRLMRDRLPFASSPKSVDASVAEPLPACSFCQRTHESRVAPNKRTLSQFFASPQASSSLLHGYSTNGDLDRPPADAEMAPSVRPIELATCEGCGELLCARCSASQPFSFGGELQCVCFDCAMRARASR